MRIACIVSLPSTYVTIRTLDEIIMHSHVFSRRILRNAYTPTHIDAYVYNTRGFRIIKGPYRCTNELYIILTYERHYRSYESFAKREGTRRGKVSRENTRIHTCTMYTIRRYMHILSLSLSFCFSYKDST